MNPQGIGGWMKPQWKCAECGVVPVKLPTQKCEACKLKEQRNDHPSDNK
jgi:hypothetical protein